MDRLPRLSDGFVVSTVLLCFLLGGLVTVIQIAFSNERFFLQYLLFGVGSSVGLYGALLYLSDRTRPPEEPNRGFWNMRRTSSGGPG